MEFLFIAENSKKSVFILFVNPVALGLAKTQLSFSLFECSRVNEGVCGYTTLCFLPLSRRLTNFALPVCFPG